MHWKQAEEGCGGGEFENDRLLKSCNFDKPHQECYFRFFSQGWCHC